MGAIASRWAIEQDGRYFADNIFKFKFQIKSNSKYNIAAHNFWSGSLDTYNLMTMQISPLTHKHQLNNIINFDHIELLYYIPKMNGTNFLDRWLL